MEAATDTDAPRDRFLFSFYRVSVLIFSNGEGLLLLRTKLFLRGQLFISGQFQGHPCLLITNNDTSVFRYCRHISDRSGGVPRVLQVWYSRPGRARVLPKYKLCPQQTLGLRTKSFQTGGNEEEMRLFLAVI